jgi:uncharacterized protein (TIGR03435 family)
MKNNLTPGKTMKSTMTKTTVTVGLTILAAVAAAVVVKQQFPPVKDSFFYPDTHRLRQVPANLVTIRPTHFPNSAPETRHVLVKNGETILRMVGRNLSFAQVMAEAYDCNPSRVALPPEAPKGGFDFLVTTGSDARKHLQTVVRKKLGFVAQRETRDTEVQVLKVADSSLPGLTASADDEKAGVSYKEGKLYFTHQHLDLVLNGLSAGLKQPVLDQAGLTNYYDFSVPWNPVIQHKMQAGGFSLEGVEKLLAGWGLRLETDSQPLEMLVVEKAR